MRLSRAYLCIAVLLFTVLFVRGLPVLRSDNSQLDAILVLAGGVDTTGRLHKTVSRRLRRAQKLYSEQRAAGGPPPAIVCNGGGTTHKPRGGDPATGFAVAEAALMGQRLVELGVERRHIFLEGHSDDTIGNALMARLMHADARPSWRRLAVVSSEFQMARCDGGHVLLFSLIWTYWLGSFPRQGTRHLRMGLLPLAVAAGQGGWARRRPL